MNFKIERKWLLDACKKILRTTASAAKNITPELSGFLIEADAGSGVLRLTSTDLTVSMMMKLKNIDIQTSGNAVVPASLFTSMLGAMTDEIAAVMINGTTLMLQCGNPIFHMTVMDANNFPNVNIAFPENTVCVSGLSLITKQTAAVVSENADNPSYNGVQVRFSPDVTTATSTDGIRFVKSRRQDIADGTLDVFIPERSLKLLCGIVKASDDIYIGVTGRTAVFMTSELVFSTRLMNGDLNRVENLIEKVVPKYGAVVDAKELYQAVDSCMVMVSGADSCVNLAITDKMLRLSVDNENGSMSIDVTAEKSVNTDGKNLFYNPKFMLDFLKSCSGAVKVEINETGILKLKSGITDYIISARGPAKIKEKKETPAEEKSAPKKKSTKGKAVKNAA